MVATTDASLPVDAVPPDAAVPGSARILYLMDGETDDIDELYLVQISDGIAQAPVKLNQPLAAGMGVRSFAWSPDGSKVLYVADTDATDFAPDRREAFVVDLGAGVPTTPVRVNQDLWPDTSIGAVKWSPDSTRIAYIAAAANNTSRQYELFIYNVAGSTAGTRVKVNTALPLESNVLDFAWAPGPGSMIAYRGNQDNTNFGLYVVDTSTAVPGAPVKVSPAVTGGQGVLELAMRGWGWAPNGERLFIIARSIITDTSVDAGSTFYVNDLFVVDFTGQVPDPPVKVERNSVENLTSAYWSPNSQRLAMTTYSNGFIVDVSTAVPGDVYQLGYSWTDPFLLWSPDSTKLAFHGPAVDGGPRQLWVVDATVPAPSAQRVNGPLPSGGEVLGSSTGAWAITWTGDSHNVIYTAEQDMNNWPELYMVDVSGSTPTAPKKLNPPGGDPRDIRRYIDYHRATSRVLFAGRDLSGPALSVYAVDVSSGTPGTPAEVNDTFVPGGNVLSTDVRELGWGWSKNAQFVAYVADQDVDERFELFVVPMTGVTPGTPVRINTSFPPGDVSRFAWAP